MKRLISIVLSLTLLLGLSLSAGASELPASADVVVVGGGLAGMTAAIAASESGANVVLVEKLPMTGGSSAYSGGGISAPGSVVQKEFGIEDSAESWRALWTERQNQSIDENAQYPDMERVDWMIGETPDLIDWFIAMGYTYVRPEGYGVDEVERIHYVAQKDSGEKGMGGILLQYLAETAAEKGVSIFTETPAISLVQGDDGAITGVVVQSAGAEATIEAQAVVLAAGGFAGSAEALQKYIPDLPAVTSVASPGTTGDGMQMAVDAGGVLYEDPWVIGLYSGVPGSPLANLGYSANLYVNAEGQRIMNEWQHYALITNDIIEEGGVAYSIWDSSNADLAAMIEANLGEYAFKGDTFEELAEAAGIDGALAETMAAYNGYAAAGEDQEFGKDPAFLQEIATAPYYAIKMLPNVMGSIGGVKTLLTGEVVDAEGNAIPGLYAAGENANRAFFNQVYMSGGALAIAATTGREAGRSAAAFVQ